MKLTKHQEAKNNKFIQSEGEDMSKLGVGVHKIGKHGAIFFVTSKGNICIECGKKIHNL